MEVWDVCGVGCGSVKIRGVCVGKVLSGVGHRCSGGC